MDNAANQRNRNSESIVDEDVAHTPKKSKFAVCIILLTLVLERTAYYAVFSSFYLFLNHRPFAWSTYNAAAALLVFFGLSCIASPLGGLVADFRLGRYWGSVVSLIIYICGYVFLPLLAWNSHKVPRICLWKKREECELNTTTVVGYYADYGASEHPCSNNEPCLWLVYIVLGIIAIGTGWFRAVIVPFGADQVRYLGSGATTGYFNWLYWCVNIGALIALGAFGYVQQSFVSGFFWSYFVPLLLLFLGLLLMSFSFRAFSVVSKSKKNIFKDIYSILKEAHSSKRRRQNSAHSLMSCIEQPSWLDMAKLRYGGKFHDSAVEDVKSLGRILIVFFFMIPYWVIYYQMQTTFQAQGIHMRLDPAAKRMPVNKTADCLKLNKIRWHRNHFSIPQAWLLLFNTIFVIIFLPILDRVVYPFLERRGLRLSLLSRMAIGMVLAMLSMISAGVLETYRLTLLDNNNQLIIQFIGNTTYFAANMNVFWQVPQYALIGLGEVLTTVAGLEYAYSEAPKSIQGMIMGSFNLMSGIGSFLGAGLLLAMKPVLFKENHHGHLEYGRMHYYFFLLAGLQAIGFIFFVITIKTKFKPKSNPRHRNDSAAAKSS